MTALVALTLCAGALTGVSHDEPKDTPHQSLLTPGVPLKEERGHRIVRRSINFGRPEDVGTSPVGMYFLCFQADLGLQFGIHSGDMGQHGRVSPAKHGCRPHHRPEGTTSRRARNGPKRGVMPAPARPASRCPIS